MKDNNLLGGVPGLNTEKLNCRIVSLGKSVDTRPMTSLKYITLEKILQWIDDQDPGDLGGAEVIPILKKTVSQYPQQALENFIRNIDTQVIKIRAKLNRS